MNICLVGNSLTGLVLAKSLINKKVKVTMYHKKEQHTGDGTRTIGISSNNIKFIQKEIININKAILWDINQIEIYDRNKNSNAILNFKESRKKLFFMIKNDDLYKLLDKSLKKNINFKKKK